MLVLVGNEVGNVLDCGFRAAQGKRVSLFVVKVRYMNGYEPVERDGVVQSVISNMLRLEDLFGLSRVWYIRDLGCPFMLYTAFGQRLRPYESNVYIYAFIYIHM